MASGRTCHSRTWLGHGGRSPGREAQARGAPVSCGAGHVCRARGTGCGCGAKPAHAPSVPRSGPTWCIEMRRAWRTFCPCGLASTTSGTSECRAKMGTRCPPVPYMPAHASQACTCSSKTCKWIHRGRGRGGGAVLLFHTHSKTRVSTHPSPQTLNLQPPTPNSPSGAWCG